MKKTSQFLVLFSLFSLQTVSADDADRFIGTWTLDKIESRSESGEWQKIERWGDNPFGVIMYDSLGNMAVQLAYEDRDSASGTVPNSEVVNGYVAYVATYDVNSSQGTVTHHRLFHTNPNADGLSVVRYYEFDDDTLTLTVAPDRNIRLTWIRQDQSIKGD
jgi:hypothetical protein